MAGKYAMLWTSSRGYMPGTNASLNAMEHYGFKLRPDIYLLEDGMLPEEYRAQWPGVTFENVYEQAPPGLDNGWYYVYSDVIKAIELLKDYDVVLLWGGDLCILNDFSVYFELSEKLEAMVLGTNEHGSHYMEDLSPEWPYRHTWSVPYADVPFFVPKKWVTVLEKMIEYTKMPGCEIDRMDGMNYAIRDCDAKVYPVPGELWVQNVPYRYPLVYGRNKTLYISESSTFLYSFHRRYWQAQICREYLPGGKEPWSAISKRNKMIFNHLYNFFNTQCRVTWTESLETWDGN